MLFLYGKDDGTMANLTSVINVFGDYYNNQLKKRIKQGRKIK